MKTKDANSKTLGRPTDYSVELASAVCGALALGKSLGESCEEVGIGVSTVYLWLREKADFLEMYTRAREDQAHTMFDSIVKIADEDPATIMSKAKDGSEDCVIRVDSAAVNHQRLRVDARKWAAAKLLPKKYGDRTHLEHSGEIGLAPDMNACADQLITQATAYPTLNPVIRKWLLDTLERLPRIEE